MSTEIPENVIVVKQGDRLTFVTQLLSSHQVYVFTETLQSLFPGVIVQVASAPNPIVVVHQPEASQ